jgi:hypothetical protein
VVGLGIGEPGTASGAGAAGGPSGAGPGAGPSGSAAGAGPGEGGEFHRGGRVPNRTRGTLEERIVAQEGEYVVRRGPATKYRKLLEAINRDRPAEVKRLTGRLCSRMVA